MAGRFGLLARGAGVGALAFMTVAAALTVGAGAASAATADRYVATSGTDSENDCSDATSPCLTIQHAVSEAASGDTVHVAAGEYPETVTISKPLTVVGAGSGATNVSGNHDNGPSFYVESDSESFIDVTLKDLSASHNTWAEGVDAFGVNLTISNVVISDDRGVGIAAFLSTVDVSDSVVADIKTSQAIPQVAALGGPFADGSGIIAVLSAAHVQRTAVRDNEGSGIELLGQSVLALREAAAAIELPQPSLDVSQTTVSGNQVGGVLNNGGAVIVAASTVAENVGRGVVNANRTSTATVTNSTITGTKPFSNGGSADEQGGIVDLTTLTTDLAMSSAQRSALRRHFTALAADNGPLVKRAARKVAAATPDVPSGTTVVGSIVAKQAGLPDCSGAVIDGGYNLSSDAGNSCQFTSAKNDLVKTDPLLGPLADNGGPTKTELLKKGSPAIDYIPAGSANCTASGQDQRGISLPQPTGGKCDIGAVELAAQPLAIHPDSLPHGTVGKEYSQTITATGGQYPSYTFALESGALPPGLAFDAAGHITGTPSAAGTYHFTVSVNDPVLKDYTIVVDEPVAPSSPSTPAPGSPTNPAPNGSGKPIAQTGAPVGSLAAVGAGTVLAGFLALVWAGLIGRRPGRHRA